MQIIVDQVVTAGAYTAGMAVGPKIALPGLVPGVPFRCAIVDLILFDKAGQQQPYDLALFDADLAGTVADHQTFNLHANDRSKYLGHIPLSSVCAMGTGGAGIIASNLYKRLTLIDGNAWGVLIARGTPTFASISDVSLRITAEQVWA